MQDNWKHFESSETDGTNSWRQTFPDGENRITGEQPFQGEDPVKPLKKVRKGRKAVQEFLGGDYLTREWVIVNLPYLLYVAVLAMIYIGNTYYTEKKFKDIEHTKNELKELRYQYITNKSVLMFRCRQSEISKQAFTYGLKETMLPPYKILYSGATIKTKKE
ncbi:MAG: FtsL-like putative cell division protein [Bacteroidota bacterium]